MKLFVVILSLFTITLSAIPCDDDLSVGTDLTSSISQDSHGDSHSDVDACSPFCTCVCCATVVVHPIAEVDILVPLLDYSEIHSYYEFINKSDYLNRIFQPPQV